MKFTKAIILFFILGLSFTTLQAQQSISSTSGIATGSGGSMTFSVGLIVYKTLSGSGGSLYPGDQQPRELSTEFIDLNSPFTVSAFPNPANDVLSLRVGNFQANTYSYQLTDLYGKTVSCNSVTSDVTQISINDLSKGVYFLRVVKNNQEVQTIKIIKS